MSEQRIAGFRLGIYVFKDAEIVDFAAPHGVFSVARRFDPELEAFLIADANRPVQAQAGFTPSSSREGSGRGSRSTTDGSTSSSPRSRTRRC